MTQNPNWPLTQALWAPTGHIGYGTSWDSYEDFPWIDVSTRTIDQYAIDAGRAYEINQQQTGKWVGAWQNFDGAFDPSNTNSVYAPNVVPYRAFRVRGQWPLGGANLLTVDQATSGEGTVFGAGANPSLFGIDYLAEFISEWQVVASATAYQGTQVCEITYTAGATAGQLAFYTRYPATAGQPYSYTIHARCMTSGQNPMAQAQIIWYSAGGTVLGTTSGIAATLTGASGTWTTLTASTTAAPAGAAIAQIGLNFPFGASGTMQLQADGMQFENNASPSGFAVPNPWYNIFTAGVEQYPQSWSATGVFGKVKPTATDTFGLLSQSVLGDPLTVAVFTPVGGSGPTFAYMLADPSGSSLFADTVGQRTPATSNNAKAGGGTITAGTAQTAATLPGGLFQGAPNATVTNITSTTPAGTNAYSQPMSWIGLPANNSGMTGPGNGTGLGFTRMVAFRCTAAPAAASALWVAQNTSDVDQVSMVLGTGNSFVVAVEDSGHSGSLAAASYTVGDWHLGWLGVAANGATLIAGVDNTIGTYAAGGGGNYTFSGGFTVDQVGCAPVTNDPRQGNLNFEGDLAFAVEWPFVLSSAQVTAVYTAWKTAYSGQSSGQRYAQILQWAGWTGPTVIDTGSSTSLGPATDLMTATFQPSGAIAMVGLDAFTALQAVVDTEAGSHFVDSSGRLVFRSRASRYNSTIPTVIFGEGLPAGNGGEIPCEAIEFGSDPTLMCTLAQVTQTTTQQIFAGQNAAAQSQFGTRTRQITNQSTSGQECQDQANYVVSRYDSPVQRIQALTVHPAAMPANWGTVLGLGQGQRIRAIKRPVGAPEIIFNGFIEHISHKVDTKKPDWSVTLQCSPVDATPYAVFAALHTTLFAQATSGANSITLSPLGDSATNPAAGQLYVGQQLTLGPGTPASQTVTVTSVATTVAGYSSVAVGITPAAGSTFAAGVTVCEALPALSSTTYSTGALSYTPPGPTNPAQWDSTAFSAANFAY